MTREPDPGALAAAARERRTLLALAAVNLPFLLLNAFLGYGPFLGAPEEPSLRAFVAASFGLHFVSLAAALTLPLWLSTRGRFAPRLALFLGPGLFGLLQAFLVIDARIFSNFRFHVNGFILEVLVQEDAFKVLGLETGDAVIIGAIVGGIWIGELAAFLLLRRLMERPAGEVLARAAPRAGWLAAAVVLFAALVTAERFTFALLHHLGRVEATSQAHCLPFYIPVTMQRWLDEHCPDLRDQAEVALRPGRPNRRSRLVYPKAPLPAQAADRRLNLVWIVVEAWRPDFLTPEVMPETHRFAAGSLRGTRHLSGGNATRFGLFSMFYGIHASTYDYFKEERRGPVLIDALVSARYEMKVWSSASLAFFGPKDTAFVNIQDAIEDSLHRQQAQADRLVADRFLAWIEGRPAERGPFFNFLFFDATHPRFDFEPEFARWKPYLEDTSGIDRRQGDRELVLNRYRNALAGVDYHIGRVLAALERRGLLERTVVLVTGDHGAEFWEHGHFTHSSAFTEQQVAVPFLLRAPGVAPGEIGRLTSHLDVPATLLDLLGFVADPRTYSQGASVLGPVRREFAVASGWKDHAYMDDEVKVSFLSANAGLSLWNVTGRDDEPVKDPRAWLKRKSGPLVACLRHFDDFLAPPER